jgi:choline transport protein
MVTSVILNAIMQFAFCITLLFCIGDYEKVSASPLPLVEVYYAAYVLHNPLENPLH